MSPVSGLDTETMVAVGNSSKIHAGSPHRREGWWDSGNASDGGSSGSDDMGMLETDSYFTSWVKLRARYFI